ncbi:hypothetical protein NDU88_006373 [Pleurodeles waltl]|uniref:Retrotransposon gag domain-containing protein n=1 Tax=Pleurodeles waltl TaxID=8319 RepID=A0AAV7SPM3_PLEWA|nr:hypothetical protein NDU88_006373 [Pleurodeles waltl]
MLAVSRRGPVLPERPLARPDPTMPTSTALQLCRVTFKDEWVNVVLERTDINPKAFRNFDIEMLGNFEDKLGPQGLDEYYARFVQGYAAFTEPLRKLFKKCEQFIWTERQDEAIEKI